MIVKKQRYLKTFLYLTNLIKELKKCRQSKFKMCITCIKLNAKKVTMLQTSSGCREQRFDNLFFFTDFIASIKSILKTRQFNIGITTLFQRIA